MRDFLKFLAPALQALELRKAAEAALDHAESAHAWSGEHAVNRYGEHVKNCCRCHSELVIGILKAALTQPLSEAELRVKGLEDDLAAQTERAEAYSEMIMKGISVEIAMRCKNAESRCAALAALKGGKGE